PWAVDVLHEAARRAAGRHAPESAIEYLCRAVEEVPDDHRRGRLLADLGQAEALEGKESAVSRFEDAVELLDEPRELARARRGLAARRARGLGRSAGVHRRAEGRLS